MESLYRQALEIDRVAKGPTDPQVGLRLANLGSYLCELDREDEGKPLIEEALRIFRAHYRGAAPAIAETLTTLADLEETARNRATAERHRAEALGMFEEIYDRKGHMKMVPLLEDLSRERLRAERTEEAILLAQRIVSICERARGPRHHCLIIPLLNMAVLLNDQGQKRDAFERLARAEDICTANLQHATQKWIYAMDQLVLLTADIGLPDEHLRALRTALALREAVMGPGEAVSNAKQKLAMTLWRRGEHVEARRLLEEVLSLDRHLHGPTHLEVAVDHNNLGQFHKTRGQLEEARNHLEASARILVDATRLGQAHPSMLHSVLVDYHALLIRSGLTRAAADAVIQRLLEGT